MAAREASRSISSSACARAVSSTARLRRYSALGNALFMASSASSAPAQSAGRAAVVEHRLSRPGEAGRGLGRLFRDQARAVRIVAALRLDIKSAQAQELRVVALGHVAEGALGGGAVAGHLRRLRDQQQRQRIAGRQPRRVVGRAARELEIAGADGDQPAREREIAFDRAAVAEEQRDLLGRTQDAAHEGEDDHQRDHQHDEREARHHHRGLDAVAEPGDRDLAGAVGEPGKAGGKHRDRQEERDAPGSFGSVRARCRRRRRGRRRALSGARWLCSPNRPPAAAQPPAACRCHSAPRRCRHARRRLRCAPARRTACRPAAHSQG